MPHTMLRFPTVKARTGLSRSTIYLRISRGTFPAPVSLGGRAVGWIEAEVNAWLTARIAQRRLIAARGAGAPGSVRRQAQRPDRAGRGVVAEAVKKQGTLLNYWNNFPSFLFLTDQSGEADAFPSASAHSQVLTPRFVLKTCPNRCTKQFPDGILDFPSVFSSLSRRRQNRQTE